MSDLSNRLHFCLCSFQCALWHADVQYPTIKHPLHSLIFPCSDPHDRHFFSAPSLRQWIVVVLPSSFLIRTQPSSSLLTMSPGSRFFIVVVTGFVRRPVETKTSVKFTRRNLRGVISEAFGLDRAKLQQPPSKPKNEPDTPRHARDGGPQPHRRCEERRSGVVCRPQAAPKLGSEKRRREAQARNPGLVQFRKRLVFRSTNDAAAADRTGTGNGDRVRLRPGARQRFRASALGFLHQVPDLDFAGHSRALQVR